MPPGLLFDAIGARIRCHLGNDINYHSYQLLSAKTCRTNWRKTTPRKTRRNVLAILQLHLLTWEIRKQWRHRRYTLRVEPDTLDRPQLLWMMSIDDVSRVLSSFRRCRPSGSFCRRLTGTSTASTIDLWHRLFWIRYPSVPEKIINS